jgi:hypothetical protein
MGSVKNMQFVYDIGKLQEIGYEYEQIFDEEVKPMTSSLNR